MSTFQPRGPLDRGRTRKIHEQFPTLPRRFDSPPDLRYTATPGSGVSPDSDSAHTLSPIGTQSPRHASPLSSHTSQRARRVASVSPSRQGYGHLDVASDAKEIHTGGMRNRNHRSGSVSILDSVDGSGATSQGSGSFQEEDIYALRKRVGKPLLGKKVGADRDRPVPHNVFRARKGIRNVIARSLGIGPDTFKLEVLLSIYGCATITLEVIHEGLKLGSKFADLFPVPGIKLAIDFLLQIWSQLEGVVEYTLPVGNFYGLLYRAVAAK